MEITNKDVKVLGRVASITTDGIVASAEQVYDDTYKEGMFQSDINKELLESIGEVNVPTKVSELENDSNYQSAEQVEQKINGLINSAPEALDTLKELADALNSDPNFATTVTNQLSNKADKTELDKYLPLSGGEMTGAITSGITTYGSSGVIIEDKTENDLLNAAGSTTTLKTINNNSLLGSGNIEVPTTESIQAITGSNTYTGANYLTKETNLTDAVIQLDEEIKATNDNLALEHTNAEATYAKKTDVPTNVSQLTNDSGYQTEAQVSAKVSALVDSAPETLDTLNELAAALGDDPNFATTVTNQIASKQDKLVSGTNIKTINGQTLLGSGDVDMSPYFKLNSDNDVHGKTWFVGDTTITASPTESTSALLIQADNVPFIKCSRSGHNIVTISPNIISGVVYPTFYMIAVQANTISPNYEKVMFSLDRDEDGLTRLSLGNFDVSETGSIIRGTESYITSNGVTLPGKTDRHFLVGDGTTVRLSDLSNEIVMTTGDQNVSGSKKFSGEIEAKSIQYNDDASSPGDIFLNYNNGIGTASDINDYTILKATISKNTSPYAIEMKATSIEMSNPGGTKVYISSEQGGYLNLGQGANGDSPGLKISPNGLAFKSHTSNELINAGGGFISADTFVKTSSGSKTIWTGTQSEYEAVGSKDANTLYFITEG